MQVQTFQGVPTVRATTQIRLFGEFGVFSGERDMTPRSKRGRALLAYLAVTKSHSASRERLAGLLWSDRSEEQARASLRQCLHRILREVSVDGAKLPIESDRDRIWLEWSDAESDLDVIRAQIARADAASLADALEYIGANSLLPGMEVGDLFDDWLASERADFANLISAAVRARNKTLREQQDWPNVRRLSDLYLRRDPAAEDVVADALRADVAMGAITSAHRRMQGLTRHLEEEYGVEPSAQIQDLFQDLTNAAPVSEGATPAVGADVLHPPTVAVAPLNGFGRDPALEAMAQVIADDLRVGLTHFRDLRVIRINHIEDYAASASNAQSYTLSYNIIEKSGNIKLIFSLNRGDREVIWGSSFNVNVDEIMIALDEVIKRTLAAIEPSIERDIEKWLPNAESRNGVDLYWRSRILARHAKTFREASQSAALLEQAIKQNDRLANALLHLARLYNTDFLHTLAGHDTEPLRARALMLSRRANELDPNNAHVHTLLGWCHLRRSAWDLSRKYFDRAVDLNPFNADRFVEAGVGYGFLGDLGRGRELVKLALELNPYPHREYLADLAVIETFDQNFARAASLFEETCDDAPVYRAPKIVNMVGAKMPRARIEEEVEALRADLRAIWRPVEPEPSDRQLMDWLDSHMPFRREDDRQRWHRGLAAAGMRI